MNLVKRIWQAKEEKVLQKKEPGTIFFIFILIRLYILHKTQEGSNTTKKTATS